MFLSWKITLISAKKGTFILTCESSVSSGGISGLFLKNIVTSKRIAEANIPVKINESLISYFTSSP